MPDVSYFIDDSAVILRTPEVPDADWDSGLNAGGSNACGIGVNAAGGAVSGEAQQFTLLDQREVARTPQISQSVGGVGYTDPANWPSSGGAEGFLEEDSLRIGTVSASGDGIVTPTGEATLADIAVGWVSV